MSQLVCKEDYLNQVKSTRDARMQWWREARFGMFIHFGLYSQLGRQEWVMAHENFLPSEYEKLANTFNPKKGTPRKWAELAKKAGMKYMVMTTRHHEGFSLWNSKVNPYNSVNFGPKRDIVQEFVDACREFNLKIGFYSSLMDWHHPDSSKCAYDSKARTRFNKYIEALNTELLTNYGKIDILWYDVPRPLDSYEGWNSLEMNQHMRTLQPDIIINDRSKLPEDFSTPEEHVIASERDWEACMTFNGISWGYIDSKQASNYSYTPQQIIKMLNYCSHNGGNLLLNIGPKPDGTIPSEVIPPLTLVGKWLKENKDAVYGKKLSKPVLQSNGVSGTSFNGKSVYIWNFIWPINNQMTIGGYFEPPKKIQFLKDKQPIEFEFTNQRIILKNLPTKPVDNYAGITVIEMIFDKIPKFVFGSHFPQLHKGKQY